MHIPFFIILTTLTLDNKRLLHDAIWSRKIMDARDMTETSRHQHIRFRDNTGWYKSFDAVMDIVWTWSNINSPPHSMVCLLPQRTIFLSGSTQNYLSKMIPNLNKQCQKPLTTGTIEMILSRHLNNSNDIKAPARIIQFVQGVLFSMLHASGLAQMAVGVFRQALLSSSPIQR